MQNAISICAWSCVHLPKPKQSCAHHHRPPYNDGRLGYHRQAREGNNSRRSFYGDWSDALALAALSTAFRRFPTVSSEGLFEGSFDGPLTVTVSLRSFWRFFPTSWRPPLFIIQPFPLSLFVQQGTGTMSARTLISSFNILFVPRVLWM